MKHSWWRARLELLKSSCEGPGGKFLSREEVRMAWTEEVRMMMGKRRKLMVCFGGGKGKALQKD